MKIKMKIRYRKSWLFLIGAALVISILLMMARSFILEDNNYAFAFLCFCLIVLILVAVYFRFNYGITINEKRVVAIEQAKIKRLRYDDISSIIVKFTNESVTACIKMKNQQKHVFVWDYILLGTNVILPNKNKIRLYDSFVEESIESLSKCPKVKIQNFYDPE